MQETAIPQRLARSAKYLASATLTGSNFELRDPRESKQAGSSSTQTSLGNKEHCSGNVHSKSNSRHQQSDFRSRPDSMTRRQTEEEFDHFQITDDFQRWQNPGLAASSEPVRDGDVVHGVSPTVDYELHVTNAVSPNAAVKDHITDMLDLSETPKSTSIVETESARAANVSYSHASAIQRLHQIGAQLQRNMAMQSMEQHASTHSHMSMHDILSDVQVKHAHNIVDEFRESAQSDEHQQGRYVNEQQMSSSHPAARNKASSPTMQKGKEKEKEQLQRRFHCPYYACHQNMQILSTSTSSSSQRSCVHAGCDFHGESFDSWADHVHTPHHDLQGSS